MIAPVAAVRWALLISAVGACLWAVAAGPTPGSVAAALALGAAWFALSKRKERELDGPRGK